MGETLPIQRCRMVFADHPLCQRPLHSFLKRSAFLLAIRVIRAILHYLRAPAVAAAVAAHPALVEVVAVASGDAFDDREVEQPQLS